MALAQFQTKNLDLSLMQNSWATDLNPIIQCPLVNGLLLTNIAVTATDNVINHKLGRKLIGWIVVGQDSNARFFDKQATNQMADKTLVLNANNPANINLWVF